MGEIISKYELLEELGTGGFGKVFKVKDTDDGTICALKIPHKEYESKFLDEVKLTKNLIHPNIIRYIDSGTYNETPFLIVEYADGGSLDTILEEGKPLDYKSAISISLQVLSALDFAHNRNIVHLDIKPHNILMDSKGSVKLSDFGLARLISGYLSKIGNSLGSWISPKPGTKAATRLISKSSDANKEYAIWGTLSYMSPEQKQGKLNDQRNDIFSLGTVLYQMLVGDLPGGFDKPSELNSNIPEELDDIVIKSLRTAERRYQTAREFYDALQPFVTGVLNISTKPSSTKQSKKTEPIRHNSAIDPQAIKDKFDKLDQKIADVDKKVDQPKIYAADLSKHEPRSGMDIVSDIIDDIDKKVDQPKIGSAADLLKFRKLYKIPNLPSKVKIDDDMFKIPDSAINVSRDKTSPVILVTDDGLDPRLSKFRKGDKIVIDKSIRIEKDILLPGLDYVFKDGFILKRGRIRIEAGANIELNYDNDKRFIKTDKYISNACIEIVGNKTEPIEFYQKDPCTLLELDGCDYLYLEHCNFFDCNLDSEIRNVEQVVLRGVLAKGRKYSFDISNAGHVLFENVNGKKQDINTRLLLDLKNSTICILKKMQASRVVIDSGDQAYLSEIKSNIADTVINLNSKELYVRKITYKSSNPFTASADNLKLYDFICDGSPKGLELKINSKGFVKNCKITKCSAENAILVNGIGKYEFYKTNINNCGVGMRIGKYKGKITIKESNFISNSKDITFSHLVYQGGWFFGSNVLREEHFSLKDGDWEKEIDNF